MNFVDQFRFLVII